MKLALAYLLLAATAFAQPGTSAPKCAAHGTPLLEIQEFGMRENDMSTKDTQIFDSGAWSFLDRTVQGTALPTTSGCLDPVAMDKIRAGLKSASWKLIPKGPCNMIGVKYTQYAVNGKQVWTAKACSEKALDAGSAKALADLRAVLTAAHVPLPQQ
jgi:hypothetical protein